MLIWCYYLILYLYHSEIHCSSQYFHLNFLFYQRNRFELSNNIPQKCIYCITLFFSVINKIMSVLSFDIFWKQFFSISMFLRKLFYFLSLKNHYRKLLTISSTFEWLFLIKGSCNYLLLLRRTWQFFLNAKSFYKNYT